MPVKLRLQRRGRKKQPFYHIVAADARAPRDGKFIEKIGTYNPMTKPATIDLDRDLAYEWLMKGAQPTDTVRAILRFKGVLYKKHLQRGVIKGAITQEAADAKLQEWIEAKESKVNARREQTAAEHADFLKKLSGVAPPPPAPKKEDKEEDRPEQGPKLTLAEELEAKGKAEEEAALAAQAETEAPKAEEKPAEEAKTEEPAPQVEAKEEASSEETAPVAKAKEEEKPAATAEKEEQEAVTAEEAPAEDKK